MSEFWAEVIAYCLTYLILTLPISLLIARITAKSVVRKFKREMEEA